MPLSQAQTKVRKISGVIFLDLTHTDKVDPKRFWAVDGFHPGTFGYVVMADAIMHLLFDGAKE